MAKKHRGKSKSIYIMIGILVVASVFIIMTLSSATNVEILGVKTSYNIGRILTLFEGSQLSIAPSGVIKCYSGISMYGYTETDRKVILSNTNNPFSYAYANFDITTTGGTLLKSVEVSPFLYCDNISTTYYPNLTGGKIHVDWYGTKQDGTKVTLLSADANVPTGGQNIAGKVFYFGAWKLTKDEIESKLGVGGLSSLTGTQNFKSMQSVSYRGQVNFLQGTVVKPIWYYDVAGLTTYSLTVQPVNPLAVVSGQKVELKVDTPADLKVNLNGYRVVTLTGTLDKWTAEEGYPTLKLFYTDPVATASERTTPLFVKLLSPSSTSSGETKFTSGFAFSSNAKHGEYTFEFSAKGRLTVAKASVYVSSSPVTTQNTGQTQNPVQDCTAPLVKTTDGNCINPNPPQDQSNPAPDQVCDGTNLSGCLKLPDFGKILMDNIGWIVLLIIIIIIIMIASKGFSGKPRGITISQ